MAPEAEKLERPDPVADDGGATVERGPEPAAFRSDDVVPFFRPDLRVTRGASPGLFEVLDEASGKRFALYEFELAIARMLDGRRRVSDVVESGVRLGIPVDVQGLHKFARQLWHYGFLAAPGSRSAASEADATWAQRERWNEATRALYQTGLRLMRLGRPADAAGYFEAMLDAHPGNPEATEMLALVAQGRSLAAEPGARAEPPPPRVPAPRRARRTAAALAALAAVACGAFAIGVGPVSSPPSGRSAPPAEAAAAPETPTAAAAPAPPPAPEAEPAAQPWRSGPVDARRHPALAEVVAPGAGTVRWRKGPGAAVRAGERLGELRAAAGGAPRPELARRVAELERLAAQDPVYRDFLEKARAEQRKASRRARLVPLVAPATGELARPPDGPDRVEKGAALARVLDASRWHLDVVLEPAALPPGAACEVLGDGPSDAARCAVVAPRDRDGGAEAGRVAVTVEVSAADAPWLEHARSPHVRLAPPGGAAHALAGASP